jgi:hypothetical protein
MLEELKANPRPMEMPLSTDDSRYRWENGFEQQV